LAKIPKKLTARPKNTHICKPPCQNDLKLTYSNVEFQNFSGGGPPDPPLQGEGKGGEGKGRREGRGRVGGKGEGRGGKGKGREGREKEGREGEEPPAPLTRNPGSAPVSVVKMQKRDFLKN